jgi:hypothetical protein
MSKFFKLLYRDHLRAMRLIEKQQTERDILIMERLGVIEKGQFKAGTRGALIKNK